jgi:hypothetical protein
LQVRWLDIPDSTWQEPQTMDGGETMGLKTPDKNHWTVLIDRLQV